MSTSGQEDKMPMHDKLMLLSIAFGLGAALHGIAAALTKVHSNQDKLIFDLRRQSRRAGIAAGCAALSSVLLTIQFIASANTP
jgi:hypothetical protein